MPDSRTGVSRSVKRLSSVVAMRPRPMSILVNSPLDAAAVSLEHRLAGASCHVRRSRARGVGEFAPKLRRTSFQRLDVARARRRRATSRARPTSIRGRTERAEAVHEHRADTGIVRGHLTVGDLDRSIAFYRDVLGLPLAHRIPARQVAFFWVPTPEKSMLGLWSIGTSPLRMRLHIAFQVELHHVFGSVRRCAQPGWSRGPAAAIRSRSRPCSSWMPAASVYFEDPDGHSLEFICMLDEAPRPELGQVSWTAWRRHA